MIPNVKDRQLQTSEVTESATFSISNADSAHIMVILRDTLYSDKILAVIREYFSNAWDANRSVGKGDVPVKITLPSLAEPNLVIRDVGPGLSRHDIFTVYSQYGASTKRNDDNTVGMLGIGSKSGFAYSDSFTITSWHGGVKSIYVAVLDESDRGVINLLHEEECPLEETGVEILIAVKPDDINEFTEKAKNFLAFVRPRPETNIELQEEASAAKTLKHGYVFLSEEADYNEKGWVAVMGCVPYRINLSQLTVAEYGIGAFVHSLSGVVKFNIGEVQINASREELKYSDSTKKILAQRIHEMIDDYTEMAIKEIEAESLTPWERRLKSKFLQRLNLPLPKEYKDSFVTEMSINTKDHPPSFYFTGHTMKEVSSITISEYVYLFVKDESKSVKGFSLGQNAVIVRKRDKAKPWDEVKAELMEYLATKGMSGITIKFSSQETWVKPFGSSSTATKEGNPIYRKKCFVFLPRQLNRLSSSKRSRKSLAWDPVEREPQPTDVYVVIENFDNYALRQHYSSDLMLAQMSRKEMPPIYAYKSTEKRPVDSTKLVGTSYENWRVDFRKSLVNNRVLELVHMYQWFRLRGPSVPSNTKGFMRCLRIGIGKDHPLLKFMGKYIKNNKLFRESDSAGEAAEEFLLIEGVKEKVKAAYSENPNAQWEALMEKYPLLESANFPSRLYFRDDGKAEAMTARFTRYIRLIDKEDQEKEAANAQQDSVHDDKRDDQRGSLGEEPHSEEGGAELRDAPQIAAE